MGTKRTKTQHTREYWEKQLRRDDITSEQRAYCEYMLEQSTPASEHRQKAQTKFVFEHQQTGYYREYYLRKKREKQVEQNED